jgi:hypothetical protein
MDYQKKKISLKEHYIEQILIKEDDRFKTLFSLNTVNPQELI